MTAANSVVQPKRARLLEQYRCVYSPATLDCQDQVCVDAHCGDAITTCTNDHPVDREELEPGEGDNDSDDESLSCGGIVECFQGM